MGRHCLDVSRSGIGHCACPRGCGSGVAEREIDAEAKEEAGTETEADSADATKVDLAKKEVEVSAGVKMTAPLAMAPLAVGTMATTTEATTAAFADVKMGRLAKREATTATFADAKMGLPAVPTTVLVLMTMKPLAERTQLATTTSGETRNPGSLLLARNLLGPRVHPKLPQKPNKPSQRKTAAATTDLPTCTRNRPASHPGPPGP